MTDIAPVGDRSFGAFEYFPDDLEWSTQMLRLFSYCYVRGADFTEVHAVARTLPVGDDAAWERGFSELAHQIEASAHASAAGGHDVTARDLFLRATIYHRISGQMADIAGEVDVPPGLLESVRCFREASARMDWAHGALLFIAGGVLLALLAEFAVAPRIMARENIRVWHTIGSAMYVLQWVCAGVTLWKVGRLQDTPSRA